MMKVCEVCGSVEELENQENELEQTRILHLCENCQKDRTWDSLDLSD